MDRYHECFHVEISEENFDIDAMWTRSLPFPTRGNLAQRFKTYQKHITRYAVMVAVSFM